MEADQTALDTAGAQKMEVEAAAPAVDDAKPAEAKAAGGGGEEIKVKLVFKGKTTRIPFGLDKTIGELKAHLEKMTGCAVSMQKLCYKGSTNDDAATLRAENITPKTKVLLVGPTAEDLLQQAAMAVPITDDDVAIPGLASREPEKPWCELPLHRKVLDKGVPADVMMGYSPLDGPEPIPGVPLVFFDLHGKVRLTFKMMEQMVVMGTKERTQRIPLQSVHDCKSQPIAGHEAYHILAIQFGPTEKSTKYFYWVPAQYVRSIVNLLGK